MTKPPDYADMEVVGHVATRAGGLPQLAGLRRASTSAWWRWMGERRIDGLPIPSCQGPQAPWWPAPGFLTRNWR